MTSTPHAVNRPRRVLFVDHTATLSGGEIAMLDLVQHLDRSRCVPIVVLCAHGKLVSKLAEAGVECHVLPLARSVVNSRKDRLGFASLTRLKDLGRVLAYSQRLADLIREHDIDVVHANSLKADVLGGLAARRAGRPLIWHVRDRIDRDYLPATVAHAFRWLCRWMPDCVIANSNATMATLRLPRTSHRETVYSGIRRSLIAPDDGSAAKTATPSSTHGARIGLVGRIAPWKGQHLFVKAAARVVERFPAARFLVIGSAMFKERAYEREVKRQADALGLNGSMQFLGFRENVHEWIAGLDVLVHASVTGEPFGKVVVEGMAAGKPVVATRGGGIPEIVIDGETGVLVPMGDHEAMAAAITRLLSDPASAHDMGRRGRRRVQQHFTIDRAARRVEQIYETVHERWDLRRRRS